MTRDVVYVDGLRTAFGRAGPKGMFWRTRADDMAVKVVRELLRRNPELPPERIGDVVLAATAQVGDQGLTLGRSVSLLAGIPESVPGLALDRMCAGALTAVTVGAGEIALGAADVVLAGGVEHMGHHPMAAEVDFNPRFVTERLVDESAVTMGATAENLHDRFPHLTKADADAFAVRSQQRAAAAWEDGVMRETADALGLEPRMRLVGYAFAGVEPELMGLGPIPATQRVLEQAGLTIDDVDLFELNEPFAVQVLTWCDGMGIDPEDDRLNPYGGAIACGHPLAATGGRLVAQLAYAMRERGARYGLTALCVGMGMGAAVLWENLSHSRPSDGA